jgi:D-aminopeptidase
VRAGDLGIIVGTARPGEFDAITDVPGVRVGHTTLIEGEGPLVVGTGPVRTGVTVIVPSDEVGHDVLMAGCHRLNGNGELTGLEWVRESGLLTTPIALTNTHSVGVVHDALIAADVRRRPDGGVYWSLPVVGETWDGALNDVNGFHVKPEHVWSALKSAAAGPVAEGNVGGGTGMICHGFKGGIGTASRVLSPDEGGWTVGVLVQANHGRRSRLAVNGVRVGEAIPTSEVQSPWIQLEELTAARVESGPNEGSGSIIVVVATDAPLLPTQCDRLAQRAALGIGRTGGAGENSSGDIILAFATGNRGASSSRDRLTLSLRVVRNEEINPLFYAMIEATEEAIVNALLQAETMTGRDGITAYRLDPERVRALLASPTGGNGSLKAE